MVLFEKQRDYLLRILIVGLKPRYRGSDDIKRVEDISQEGKRAD